jgi:hypothetical protein
MTHLISSMQTSISQCDFSMLDGGLNPPPNSDVSTRVLAARSRRARGSPDFTETAFICLKNMALLDTNFLCNVS